MHTTINLNDQLLGQARLITGMTEPAALLHAGLDALIERRNAPVENSARITDDQSAEYTSENKPIQLCTEAEKRQRIQEFLDFSAREGFPVEKLDIPSREERNAR